MGWDKRETWSFLGFLHAARMKIIDSKESKLYADISLEKRTFRDFARKFMLESGSDYAHYFSALGIKPTADKKEIRKAYVAMIKKYHPDVNKGLRAEEITKEANAAYRFLSNYNMHVEDESLPRGSRSIMLDALYSEYERLLEIDYGKLKNLLGEGAVERWYYDQEVGKFLDWRKRSALAVNNVLGDFMSLGGRLKASIKAGRKLDRHETDGLKITALRGSIDEIGYIYSRYTHFKKLIDESVLRDFYASAKRHSEETRKRMAST